MKKILIQIIIISLSFVTLNAKADIKSITEGNVDAKVKLIVFESLTCQELEKRNSTSHLCGAAHRIPRLR